MGWASWTLRCWKGTCYVSMALAVQATSRIPGGLGGDQSSNAARIGFGLGSEDSVRACA